MPIPDLNEKLFVWKRYERNDAKTGTCLSYALNNRWLQSETK